MNTRVISEGPAVVAFNGQNYYTEGTITLTPDLKLREKTSALHGTVDRRVTDKLFTLAFTPFGEMNGNAAKYFPFTAADIGRLIAPATDTPVVIYAASGERLAFPAGCILACPQLLLGTDKGPMGEMSIACMGDLAGTDAADGTHYAIDQAQISAHTLNPDHAPTPAYKAILGEGADAIEIDGETGFTFDIGAELTPRAVNRYGTVNFRLSALNPSIAFQPFGPSIADIAKVWNIQGAGAARLGASNRLRKPLTLSPADPADKGPSIRFPDCMMREGSMLFGMSDPRHGQYALVPAMRVTGGIPEPLFSIDFPTW